MTNQNETKTVRLSDLLTKEQVKECCKIINRGSRYSNETIGALKEYLGQFKEELEAKGVLPDYLAYMLIFLTTQEQ